MKSSIGNFGRRGQNTGQKRKQAQASLLGSVHFGSLIRNSLLKFWPVATFQNLPWQPFFNFKSSPISSLIPRDQFLCTFPQVSPQSPASRTCIKLFHCFQAESASLEIFTVPALSNAEGCSSAERPKSCWMHRSNITIIGNVVFTLLARLNISLLISFAFSPKSSQFITNAISGVQIN